jgi:hypothetical protein
MVRSTLPGVPEPFTYERLAGLGAAVNVVGGTTCNDTTIVLSGAGALAKWTVNVFVVPAAKEPHPDAATKDRFTAVALAVPPVSGATVSHDGKAYVLFSTVNGVPPVVADFTPTVTAGPGVYTGPVGFRVQVSVTALGNGVSDDVTAAVTVKFTVTVTSTPLPVLKRNVGAVAPAAAPVQPGVALTT